MNKLYASLFFLLAAVSSKAQFAITKAQHGYTAGTTYTYLRDTITVTNTGATGANVTWDYSTRPASSQTYTEVVTAASPATQATFGNGTNLVMATSTGDTTFLRQSSGQTPDSLIITGVNYTNPPTERYVFTNPDYILKFPFNYGDAPISDATVQSTDGTGSSTTTLDGYGTLKLSTGNYPAVRTHYQLNFTATVNIGFPVQVPLTIHEYTWFGQTYSAPLYRMRFTEATIPGFGTQRDSGVFINALVASITKHNDISANVSVYPNPAAEQAKINIALHKAGDISFRIVSTTGAVAFEQQATKLSPGIHVFDLDTRSVAAGIYFINIKTADGVTTSKLVVE